MDIHIDGYSPDLRQLTDMQHAGHHGEAKVLEKLVNITHTFSTCSTELISIRQTSRYCRLKVYICSLPQILMRYLKIIVSRSTALFCT
jgi:hypothetical protein